MIGRYTVLAGLLLAGIVPLASAQDDTRLKAALKELEGFQKEIAEANAKAEELYGYYNAAKTLQEEFDRIGSKASPGSWGGWLWMQVFQKGGNLFTTTYYTIGADNPQGAVDDSMKWLRGSRVVDDEDMAYLREAMGNYRKVRDEAMSLLDQKVKLLAKSTLAEGEERKAIDKELEALNTKIDAALREHPILSLRCPAFDCRLERKDGLLMGLKLILSALELQDRRALADRAFWQRVPAGSTLFTLDTARITALDGRRTLPKNVTVSWYSRRSPDDSWMPLGTGAPEFRMPDTDGALQIYGDFTHQGKRYVMPVIHLNVRKSAVQTFHMKVLTMTADGIYWYRDAAKKTRTYDALWSADATASTSIPMAAGFVPASGDIVLRTAGALSQMMFTLGSPDSPQLHAGILKVETFRNQPVHLVHQVNVLGYEVVPLTPADAVLYQQMKGLAAAPRSFMHDANVGSVEIHRPVAVDGDGKTDAQYNLAAANRALQVGATVTSYDYAFLESSKIADKFGGAMYCNEFVRECLGRDIAAPAENALLKNFWQAAVEADREAAAARVSTGPNALVRVLTSIDLNQVTFDGSDPAKDRELREQIAGVIGAIAKFSSGTSLRALFTEKVAANIDVAAEISKAAGVAPQYVPLISMAANVALRSWMEKGAALAAETVVDEMITDLGNAIGTGELLAGGKVTQNGRELNVTFRKVSR